jgi:hypothetical protein
VRSYGCVSSVRLLLHGCECSGSVAAQSHNVSLAITAEAKDAGAVVFCRNCTVQCHVRCGLNQALPEMYFFDTVKWQEALLYLSRLFYLLSSIYILLIDRTRYE